MEQIVRVHRLRPDGMADVILVRESACSGDCHKCSGCGAAKETLLFEAVNPIGARPGELVIIRSESGPVLAGAAVLYMVPLALFFLCYYLGDRFGMGGLMGVHGCGLGFILAAVYDRKVTAKKNTVYTITGYPVKRPTDS